MTGFQILITAMFAFFIIAGVAAFALFGGAFGGGGIGTVVVWGTTDDQTMQYLIDSLRSQDNSISDVTYVKKNPSSYRSDLLNAMASGSGPDLFLVTQDDIGAFGDKVLITPYNVISQSTFLNSYLDEGRLFLTTQGALALPFSVDPLVMYWNRDLFSAAGLSQPPTDWNEVISMAPKLTIIDASKNITKSAVALGQWSNINDAKAILSALFLQAGDYITTRSSTGQLSSVFGKTPAGAQEAPAESALRFYTDFTNPGKTNYAWNRSMQNSADAFVSGQLAMYFGFASEYAALADRNPNLRMSVAVLPQLGSGAHLTYGNLSGLAISRTARNATGAMQVAQKLTTAQASAILASKTGLPSARRDAPVDTSANAAATVFVQSALVASGWVDPDPQTSQTIFKSMIESVVSGALTPSEAVSEAAQSFVTLLPYHTQ